MRTKEEIEEALRLGTTGYKALCEALEELFRLRAKLADREGLAKTMREVAGAGPAWEGLRQENKIRWLSSADKLIEYLTAP